MLFPNTHHLYSISQVILLHRSVFLLFQQVEVFQESINTLLSSLKGFPSSTTVKNLPAMQEMWVRSLGQEDPLKKEM